MRTYEKILYPSITRFAEHVQLKGLMPRTVESYVCIVRSLAEWAQRDPASLEEERVRAFFLHLLRDRGYESKSMRQARASLTAFFAEMLGRKDWVVFSTVKTKDVLKLPVVLSVGEVRAVLGAVREMRFRVCLHLIYECGLRLNEALRVETRDIGREARRLHVRSGKGGKYRYVSLSLHMINELTVWWKQHRNRVWMFPSIGYDAKGARRTTPEAEALALGARMQWAEKPMSESALQMAFRRAVQDSGLKKHATIHRLRHSYATHLLEEGVSLRDDSVTASRLLHLSAALRGSSVVAVCLSRSRRPRLSVNTSAMRRWSKR